MKCPSCQSEDIVHTLPAVAPEHRLVYLRCVTCGHQWAIDPELEQPGSDAKKKK